MLITKSKLLSGREVLQADSLLEILNNYIFYEEDEKTKEKTTIFPRYHQRDCVRELLADVKQKGAGENYLIQHSAGSGKSKTIARYNARDIVATAKLYKHYQDYLQFN